MTTGLTMGDCGIFWRTGSMPLPPTSVRCIDFTCTIAVPIVPTYVATNAIPGSPHPNCNALNPTKFPTIHPEISSSSSFSNRHCNPINTTAAISPTTHPMALPKILNPSIIQKFTGTINNVVAANIRLVSRKFSCFPLHNAATPKATV